jgi:hypothetical protein
MSLHRQLSLLTLVAIATGALLGSAVAQQHNAGGTLSQRLDVETHTFYYGQYDRLDFRLWGRRIACERASDPDKFKKVIQEICGPDREPFWKAATPDVDGTMCGYHGFSVACVKIKTKETERPESPSVSQSGSGAGGTSDATGTVTR